MSFLQVKVLDRVRPTFGFGGGLGETSPEIEAGRFQFRAVREG